MGCVGACGVAAPGDPQPNGGIERQLFAVDCWLRSMDAWMDHGDEKEGEGSEMFGPHLNTQHHAQVAKPGAREATLRGI